MAGESSYVERAPTSALAAVASSVWVQRVGDRPVAQRHEPHGGAEVRCLLGEAPRLLGPLTDTGFRPEYDVERAVPDYVGWLRRHDR